MKFLSRQPARHVLLCVVAAVFAMPLWAAPVCVDAGGFGGTGATRVERGIGGTGAPGEGIGGTGAPAAGIGGTGSPVAGIGGTGSPEAGVGGTGSPAAGVGGTGVSTAGIGGTGAPASGMGGTGVAPDGGIGGTGIVGTITGFASICVNGLEVFYDEATPTTENGQVADPRRLAIGQVVAIDAAPGERGLVARRLAILHAVAGPVTRVAAGSLEVMGQLVRPGPQVDTRRLGALRVGDVVQVSGLRNARGEVLASRVDSARDLVEHSAIGEVTGNELHGTRLAGRLPDAGGESLVRGRWDGQQLAVREVEREPSRPFAGHADHLVIEARIVRVADGRVQAGGFDVSVGEHTRFDRGGAKDLGVDDLVRITGRAEGHNGLQAERIEHPARPERIDGRGRGGRGSGSGRGDDGGRDGGDRDNRGDDRGSGSGHTGSGDQRSDRFDRPERPERAERPERVERVDRIDRPERIEVDRSSH